MELGDFVPDEYVPDHLVTPGRPEGVPEDWVLHDCANEACPYTVWSPPEVEPSDTVLMVCSTECAQVMTGMILNDPDVSPNGN